MKQEIGSHNFKNLALIVNLKEDHHRFLITYDLPSVLGRYYISAGRESIVEIDECLDHVVRDIIKYKITLLEHEQIRIESESLDYFKLICSYLNTHKLDYYLEGIHLQSIFKHKLEDIASLWTKQSPNIPINELMFINKNLTNDYSTVLDFSFYMDEESHKLEIYVKDMDCT